MKLDVGADTGALGAVTAACGSDAPGSAVFGETGTRSLRSHARGFGRSCFARPICGKSRTLPRNTAGVTCGRRVTIGPCGPLGGAAPAPVRARPAPTAAIAPSASDALTTPLLMCPPRTTRAFGRVSRRIAGFLPQDSSVRAIVARPSVRVAPPERVGPSCARAVGFREDSRGGLRRRNGRGRVREGSKQRTFRRRRRSHGLQRKDRLVKHRARVVVAGLALFVLLVSMSVAAAATKSTGGKAKAVSAAATPAPSVPNAASIKSKYGGQTITFVGDSVGGGHARDLALAKQFSKQTGIKVKVVPHPAASDASYSQLARAFSTHSSSIDVAMIDVVWPGAFAPFLVDLKPKLGQQAKLHSAGDRPERHGRREARRDAVVRRLRDALLPHRPAQEVRLQAPAGVLDAAVPDGEEDPGRREGDEPELQRLRVPGQRVRGPDVQRARVDRVVRRRPLHRRRQGDDQQRRRPRTSSTCSAPTSARRRRAA